MVRVEEGSSEWLTPYNCIEAAAGPTDSGSVLRTTVKSADEVRYDSRAGGGAISAWTSETLPEGPRCAVNAWFNPLSAFVTVLYLETKENRRGSRNG